MSRRRVVVVTSGFPRRSETFALGELLALEKRGLLAAIFATKPGDGSKLQPGAEQLLDRVRLLPDASAEQQAEALVRSLNGESIGGAHGYFAHLPAEVASIAASRLGLPFGFSAHARDARKVTSQELASRAQSAACVIACNTDVARDISRSGANVHLLPHGVNTERFYPRPLPHPEPLRLLAVGRLVEKKGFAILIAAAAELKAPFQLRIIGEGPLEASLASLIAEAKLEDRVTLCGAKTHAELPEEFASAHALVAPSIIDSTGDRDGLPNVILEAMASGRAVIASDVSAIASAIIHGETGLLVPPGNATALCVAIERVAFDTRLCAELGQRARQRVEKDYEAGRCAERFCDLIESVYA